MRRWAGWIFFWGCTLAWAEPVEVRILSEPSPVWVIRQGLVGRQGNGEVVLGNSTNPILVRPGEQLVLRHPDCEDLSIPVVLGSGRGAKTLPVKNSYRLKYRGGAKPAAKWPAGLPVLLGAAALFGWWVKARLSAPPAETKVPTALSHDPFEGTQMDGYRVEKLLGMGGMARVYRAQSVVTHEPVALKIMQPLGGIDEETLKRFEREKRIYQDLRHPNIVGLRAAGSCNGHVFLAMELVTGTTLRARMKSDGLPPRQVVDWLGAVMSALAHAHRQGIVHRDLKPENVMLTESGQIKVMDFGLARGNQYTQVTAADSVLGTPAYMAPEQIEGKLHPASDQYAVGVMLYEMLSGRLPFYDDNPVSLLVMHLQAPVPDLSEIRPDLTSFAKVIIRMLNKQPEKRYPGMEPALLALKACL
jgi:hypothetical protein